MKKLVIKYFSSDEIVREFNIENKGKGEIGRLMSGISINLNHSEYYLDIITDNPEVDDECPLESYQSKRYGVEIFGEDTQFNQRINDAKDKYQEDEHSKRLL